MKHLIYSDVHMKPENLPHVETVFLAIEKAAHEEGVIESGGYVVNNGDLFNERGVIRTSVFDLLAATRRRWAESQIKHIDNIGNHDQEDRNGDMHPLRIFDTLPGSRVIEEPTFIEGVRWWFFPYSHNLQAQLFGISHGIRPHNIAFVHAGIKDAFRNDKSRDTDGINIEHFKGFKRVFSGHYHYRHELENVQYIGSPMQHSFSEMGQLKGFLIYDDQTNKVKFIPIDDTPRHFKMELNWDAKGRQVISQLATDDAEAEAHYYDTPGMLPGPIDKVHFIVRGQGDRVRAVSRAHLATKTSALSIKIERVIEDETFSRIALDEKDHGDMQSLMTKYIGHLEPALDPVLLLEIGSSLLNPVSPAKPA